MRYYRSGDYQDLTSSENGKRPMTALPKPRAEPTVAAKFQAASEHPGPAATVHRVYLGDAREMAELEQPENVHLVVTSPPYWTLKDYDGAAGERQLGHVEDYETFHDELDRAWRRCWEIKSKLIRPVR